MRAKEIGPCWFGDIIHGFLQIITVAFYWLGQVKVNDCSYRVRQMDPQA